MRLQKFISTVGICSRRRAEGLIAAGFVSINGRIVREQGVQVSKTDLVKVRDKEITLPTDLPIYIILNKPVGVVSSCFHRGKKVVTDLVKVPERIFPIGRLDEDSCGLILLTNDGPLHHLLSHPSFDEEKEYWVNTKNPLSESDLQKLTNGVMVFDKKTRKAIVYRRSDSGFGIVLKEGRNRQIRRMVESLGNEVIFLQRRRVGHIQLGNLEEGKWRYLTDAERLTLPSEKKEMP